MSRCWMIFQSDFCVNVNYFWALRQAVRETFLCAGLSHARVPMTIFSAFNDNICHSIFNCRRLTLKEVDFTNNLRRIKFQKLILIYSQFYKHFRILIDKVNIFSVNFINNLCATLWHGKINSIIESILLIISAHYF